MKIKVVLCLAFMLSALTVISDGISKPQALTALQVVIIPSTTNARFPELFGLVLRIENTSQTNQIIRVWSCSWDSQWQSSNTNVGWIGWDCAANFPFDISIPPGGAHTNNLQMHINKWIPDKELSFRMGFTSSTIPLWCDESSKSFAGVTNTLWSNEIKLHVLPPDTWQGHNGKYYRDRNHDGKIDWEVSGAEWLGNAADPSKYVYVTNSGTVYATQQITGQGVGIYKMDTNYDGFYDVEYDVNGTNGQIQWTKTIHEPVPIINKYFTPAEKALWMDWWIK